MNRLPLLLLIAVAGCATPPPPPAPPRGPDPVQAQQAADAQCARSGKVAVKVEPTQCAGARCTTTFECR